MQLINELVSALKGGMSLLIEKARSWRETSGGRADKRYECERLSGFIEENSLLTERLIGGNTKGGAVLVECFPHEPGYLVRQAVVTRYLMAEQELRGIAVTYERSAFKTRLLESYGIDEVIALKGDLSLWVYLKATLLMVRLCGSLVVRGDVRSVSYGDVKIGKFVYDSYIRQSGKGTLEGSKVRLVPLVMRWAINYCAIREIVGKCAVESICQGSSRYVAGGSVALAGLEQGVTVYQCEGHPGRTTVTRLKGKGDVFRSVSRPSEEEVDAVSKRCRKFAIKEGKKVIADRMQCDVDSDSHPSVQQAYSRNRASISASHLYEAYGWDPGRPIVAVLPHMFQDVPSGHRWSLFRDYLSWFRYTLRLLPRARDTNWLIKPHPAEELMDSDVTAASIYQEHPDASAAGNVSLLAKDVTPASLIEFVDGLVTVRGTAALEFSCCGIPSLVAGSAPYTGFGVTIEPETKSEYGKLLEGLADVSPLNRDRVEKAQIIAFIIYKVIGAENALCPTYDRDGSNDWGSFWENARIATANWDRHSDDLFMALREQIDNGNRNLRYHSKITEKMDNIQ